MQHGQADCGVLLLSHGAHVNAVEEAVSASSPLRAFIKRTVFTISQDGHTPLLSAMLHGHAECGALLL